MSNPVPPGGAFFRSPADNGTPLERRNTRSGFDTTSPKTTDDPPARTPRPMAEGEVQGAIYRMVQDAIQYTDQELSPLRAAATRYYQGKPYGNEQPGRSQYISTDLRDAVRKVLPSLMRIFFGAEDVVEYRPRRPEQVPQAEQATRFVSDVVVRQDNPGLLVFHDWFKDALTKSMGIVKVWYDETPDTGTHHLSYQSLEQLAVLHADPQVEITEIDPCEGQPPGSNLYDVTFTRTNRQGKIVFRALPPEEFLFTRAARSVASDTAQPGVATFVGHRTELTKSQLLGMGISEAAIEAYGYKDASLDVNLEEIARQTIVRPDVSAIGPVPTQKALYVEAYPYMDVDGDGIAELRRQCLLGPGYHLISDEPWDTRPFAVICPDPEPHTVIGQGFNDYTMDIQLSKSKVARAMLDSLALSINPRVAYDETAVNQLDVLNTEVGAPIRTRGTPSAVLQEFTHAFVGEPALEVLAWFDAIKEDRIGVTKASAGLDADTLQSTTKAAVAATFTAAQQHIELIARILAETGVKDLYRLILKILVEHPDVPRMVRLNGAYTMMDPRAWDADLDIQVNVAIGAGLDDDKFATLAAVAQNQYQILTAFGMGQPMVTPKQYRDTLVKMLKLKGREDAETFYGDIPPNWQPPPQPPSPEVIMAQAEMTKANALAQQHAADIQLATLKEQNRSREAQQQLALDREQMLRQDTREREHTAQQTAVKTQAIASQAYTAGAQTASKEHIATEKVAADVAKTAHQTVVEAHTRATEALSAPATAVETPKGPEKPRRPKQ